MKCWAQSSRPLHQCATSRLGNYGAFWFPFQRYQSHRTEWMGIQSFQFFIKFKIFKQQKALYLTLSLIRIFTFEYIMAIGITEIIVILTCLISWQALNNRDLSDRFLFIPYAVKYRNEYHRILSHVLIHADFSHLAFNMISLFYLGGYLEMEFMNTYGSVGMYYFIILYVSGGIGATLLPYYKHSDNSMYRSLGASGAVSAVVFATILWEPQLELMLMFIPIPIKAYVLGPIYLAIEYYSMRRGASGIAHDAHLGGALFGILFVLLIDANKGIEFLNIFQ